MGESKRAGTQFVYRLFYKVEATGHELLDFRQGTDYSFISNNQNRLSERRACYE